MSDEESLITEYFNHSYSYLEILSFLLLHHSIVISYRTLKKRLQKLGLRRRIPPSSRDSGNVVRNEVLAQLFWKWQKFRQVLLNFEFSCFLLNRGHGKKNLLD